MQNINVSNISFCSNIPVYKKTVSKQDKAEYSGTGNPNAFTSDDLYGDTIGRAQLRKQMLLARKRHIDEQLSQISVSNPHKFELIEEIMSKLQLEEGIKTNTLIDFVQSLINLDDTRTLELALDSDVEFFIVKGTNAPVFIQDEDNSQSILFYENKRGQNNVPALAHELGHSFDCNTKMIDLLSYNQSSLAELIKNDANFRHNNNFDEAEIKYSDYDESNLQYDPTKLNVAPVASASVEYLDALQKDINNLILNDISKGRNPDYSFLVKAAYGTDNNNLGYYLGVDDYGSEINKFQFHAELFAQLVAIATSNSTSEPKEADRALVEYFPNTYLFVNHLLNGKVLR